jgi:hypothetical protein
VNSAAQFVYLTGVSPRGFTAAGNGTLRVTTRRGSYPARSLQDVAVGRTVSRVKADAAGRLTFRVVIGGPAARSQAVFPASGPPAGTPRVEVKVSAVPLPARPSSRAWIVALVAAIGAGLVSLVVIRRLRRRLA